MPGDSSAYITFNITNIIDLAGDHGFDVSSTTDGTYVLYENYDLEWANRKTITLNADTLGMSSSLSGYPMLLRLNTTNFPEISTSTEAGGADIRFSRTDGVPLHYEIEDWTDGTSATVWVRHESVSQSAPTVIWMYYDNPGILINWTNPTWTFDKSNNFQGVWHLSETSGSIANDSTANNFDGNLVGNTTSNSGMIGNGMRFDGSGDYIDTGRLASEFSIDGNKPKTGSIWVYTQTMWNRGGPFNIGTCATAQQFGFRAFSEGPDHWLAQFWGGDINFGYSSMNTWVYLAVAYDGSVAHVYADGLEVASSTVALNTTDGNPMRIGVYIQNTIFYSFLGVLDEMQLSNTCRSADWIRLDYETQKAGQTIVVVGP